MRFASQRDNGPEISRGSDNAHLDSSPKRSIACCLNLHAQTAHRAGELDFRGARLPARDAAHPRPT